MPGDVLVDECRDEEVAVVVPVPKPDLGRVRVADFLKGGLKRLRLELARRAVRLGAFIEVVGKPLVDQNGEAVELPLGAAHEKSRIVGLALGGPSGQVAAKRLGAPRAVGRVADWAQGRSAPPLARLLEREGQCAVALRGNARANQVLTGHGKWPYSPY